MKFICNDCSKLMSPDETIVGSFEGEIAFLCSECLTEISEEDEDDE